jgi:hypothetical protein
MAWIKHLLHLITIMLFTTRLCQAACIPENPHQQPNEQPNRDPLRACWKRRTAVPRPLSISEIWSRPAGRG